MTQDKGVVGVNRISTTRYGADREGIPFLRNDEYPKRRFGPDPENREPEPDWKIPPIEMRPRTSFFTIRGNPMSYSFAITGATKAEAAAKVAAEFDQVVANQPGHAADKDGAVAAAEVFINLLRDPCDGEQIAVNMYGSLSWEHTDGKPTAFVAGNVSVSASIASKA